MKLPKPDVMQRRIKEFAVLPIKTASGWTWLENVYRVEENFWQRDFNDPRYRSQRWKLIGYEKI